MVVMVRVAFGSIVCGALVAASPALARPTFPGVVQTTFAKKSEVSEEASSICPPPCMLCHTGTPSQDNPETPFALNLIAAANALGVPKDDEHLPEILHHLETESCLRRADPSCATDPCDLCNGDGSGKPDIAELRDNQNPNDSSVLACPMYGCCASAALAGHLRRSHDGAAVLVAFAGVLAFVVRRRENGRAS